MKRSSKPWARTLAAAIEAFAPLVQRARVVGADLLRVVQRQPADPRQRGEDLGDRRQFGAREDALRDPARRRSGIRRSASRRR